MGTKKRYLQKTINRRLIPPSWSGKSGGESHWGSNRHKLPLRAH
ncbi:hypothetical protein HMPREF1862_01658 [Varibaculum cambriense]|uniref:50S ribosomal protein L32 n=1 Tax=Varibaculum cambriense TaxID=184870 RepID=A0AB34WXU5_9ACTO|nr:hypothetical protein HMPREF1862_01658 [Varibaculum cambriense]